MDSLSDKVKKFLKKAVDINMTFRVILLSKGFKLRADFYTAEEGIQYLKKELLRANYYGYNKNLRRSIYDQTTLSFAKKPTLFLVIPKMVSKMKSIFQQFAWLTIETSN